jgi:UDP-N-acetylmuramoyl-L-alanyl-D-glutamate--2,6-diaminopimelate ligase
MQLDHLLRALPVVQERVGGDVAVCGIAADSRQVQPGTLFVAIPGLNVDGHRFIPEALAAGAAAVVGERPLQSLASLDSLAFPAGAFAYVQVPNAREAWAWLCTAWHGFPSRKLTVVGITGTDGKTTTVNLAFSILRAAGLNTGMTSTVSARIGDEEVDTGLHTTTPDPPDVQRYLARMVASGASHAVLEVTSHGLAWHRVTGCEFDVAAVTNVTHEHLNDHGSLEAYQQAKARLFRGLSDSCRKPGVLKTAILNLDDDSFRYLRPIPADRHLVYSLASPADVTARDMQFAPQCTTFTMDTPLGSVPVETALVGQYNVSNVLAAASVGVALGVPLQAIRRGIAAMTGVPGRMERIDEGQPFLAIVDFAHTPNALQQALVAARTMADPAGRVIVVFGSAGLRDRVKRDLMGQVAGRLADRVVITAEDPRTESLEDIMAVTAAAASAEGKRERVDLWRIADRGEALLWACQMAQPGDVVLACGKGHEQSMCFGTTECPWDDRIAMRQALRGETLDTLPTARRRR